MTAIFTAASAQMMFKDTEKFLNPSTDVQTVDDPQPGENDSSFYDRTRQFHIDVDEAVQQGEQPDMFYACGSETAECSYNYNRTKSLISFPLHMACEDTGFLASDLEFTVQFYESGIARMLIGEPDNTRFRIS